MGTALACGILLSGESVSILALSGILLAGVTLSLLALAGFRIPVVDWFLNRMERKNVRPGKGTINFFLGAYACLVLFGPYTAFVSVLILSFLDSFSTVCGMAFGRVRIRGKKTFEGTLAGFLSALAVSSLFLPVQTTLPACAASSLTELYSPVDDNILIPLVAGTVLTLTATLF